ncbi:unnamed protein product [Closterium sp. NIES-53]
MGKVGDASVFRVWGALSLVRNAKASKLSSCTLRCVFLGFPTYALPWHFYHPRERPAPSGVSQVDPPPLVEPLKISSDSSGPAEGGDPAADDTAATRRSPRLETPPGFPPRPSSPPLQPAAVDSGAEIAGAEPVGADTEGEGSGGAVTRGAATGGAGSWGAATGGADSEGAASPSGGGAPQAIRAWIVRCGSPGGGGYGPAGAGAASPRGTAGAGGTAGGAGGAAGAGGTRGAAGVGSAGATSPTGATGAGGAGPTSLGGTSGAGGAGGAAGAGGAGAGGTGGAGAAGFEVLVLEVLELPELVVLLVLEVLGVLELLALEVLELRELLVMEVLVLEVLELPELEVLAVEVLEVLLVLEVLELEVLEVLELLVLEVLELEVLELPEQVVLLVLDVLGGATGAAGTGGAGGTAGARGGGAARARVAAGARGATRAAGAAGAGSATRRLFFYPQKQSSLPPPDSVLRQVLSLLSSTGLTPHLLCPLADQSQPQLLPGSPLLAPSPHTEVSESLTERRGPETRASTPVRARRVARPRPPAVPGTHGMTLRPSSVPQRVVLIEPPASSLPHIPDPESNLARAASPTVTRLLATVVTDLDFESTAAFALVTELVDFAAGSRLNYVASLVTESDSVCPPSIGGERALSSGDPDALDIPTPRSYAEAIASEYSSHWQTAMDAKMASWKSIGTYVNEVPPPGANIVDGMWIFRVKRPPDSLHAFKARYIARGFSQRQGVDFFQIFSPTPKTTTLRVLLHVAAQRDYELHSLDFSTAFLQGSLHEEIWLCRPPGFTRPFPVGTQWSLRRPVYGLR